LHRAIKALAGGIALWQRKTIAALPRAQGLFRNAGRGLDDRDGQQCALPASAGACMDNFIKKRGVYLISALRACTCKFNAIYLMTGAQLQIYSFGLNLIPINLSELSD
jgi:hypothetical protein